MRVVLYPFFSQQNKCTGKFRLQSDSGVKLYTYIANKLVEARHLVYFVLPDTRQCEDDIQVNAYVHRVPYPLAVDNLQRRLQWEPGWLRFLSVNADIILTQHEFLAYPIKCLSPKTKVAMECGILPDTAWQQTADMFELAWDAADLIHCNSETLRKHIGRLSTNSYKATVWSFAYDDARLHRDPIAQRPCIDVLFNSRASSTNYSNHELFIAAMQQLPQYSVVMTDPTSYLRSQMLVLQWLPGHPLNTEQYLNVLRNSRVVVGLTANGYGGYAFREAIAAGALPVALRVPEYVELLGENWPYYIEELTVSAVQGAIAAALQYGRSSVSAEVNDNMWRNLRQSSYSAAWQVAKTDLERLYADRN